MSCGGAGRVGSLPQVQRVRHTCVLGTVWVLRLQAGCQQGSAALVGIFLTVHLC